MDFKKEPYAVWTNKENSISYLFHKTRDNSISVSLKKNNQDTELMHSIDGAFSETIYLYEDVVKYVLNRNTPITFLSIGLGLGYIEILVCAYMLKSYPEKKFVVYSFEKESELRDFFKKFIMGENIPDIFYLTYENIINRFCDYYGLDSGILKSVLKDAVKSSQIIFYEEYNLNIKLNTPVSGLFFDAFSANTTPELWEDELLEKALSACNNYTAFATYAARAHLKKLLLKNGFTMEKKPGYGGKKESTFAFR